MCQIEEMFWRLRYLERHLTHINNHAYRSLHKFSLNDNSNTLADQTNTATPQGTPIKRFLTNQPIVAPTTNQEDTITFQPALNTNSLYQRPSFNGPVIQPKPKDRSNALNALHQEHPDASPEELQELLKKRLRANFLHF